MPQSLDAPKLIAALKVFGLEMSIGPMNEISIMYDDTRLSIMLRTLEEHRDEIRAYLLDRRFSNAEAALATVDVISAILKGRKPDE